MPCNGDRDGIPTELPLWASIGAAGVALVFLLNLFRNRKKIIEERQIEDYRGNLDHPQ